MAKISRSQLKAVKGQIKKKKQQEEKKAIENLYNGLNQPEIAQPEPPKLDPEVDFNDKKVKSLIAKGVKPEDITKDMVDSFTSTSAKKSKLIINKDNLTKAKSSQKPQLKLPYSAGDLVIIPESNAPSGKETVGIVIDLDNKNDELRYHQTRIMTTAGMFWFRSKGIRKVN